MQNFPFNTGGNNFNSFQQNTNPQPYGGYQQQYNPPPPSLSFSTIEGRQSVDNYLVGTNVTAVLADFTNMKLYIKERDANNILKPLREFNLSEVVNQQQMQQPISQTQPQSDDRYNTMQNEIGELKQMFQSFISNQNTNNNKPKPNKGGNNNVNS